MTATDLPWMKIAHSYMGVHEGTDLKANPTVLKFFLESGHGEVKNDHRTPWCAAFVGAVLHEAGLPNSGTLWALDYAKYGQALKKPLVGAIGVKKRTGGGHVFFIAGFDAKTVYALGGNQNDRVCIEGIPRAQIVAFRWPMGVAIPTASAAGVKTAAVSGAKES